MPNPTEPLAALFEDVFARWRNRRAMQRTRRIVADLPRHIRKDIGWPEVSASDRRDPRW